jgi:hypothetical protein
MERLTALATRIYSPEACLAHWTEARTLTAGKTTCLRVITIAWQVDRLPYPPAP